MQTIVCIPCCFLLSVLLRGKSVYVLLLVHLMYFIHPVVHRTLASIDKLVCCNVWLHK
jgi:hypothetical protein